MTHKHRQRPSPGGVLPSDGKALMGKGLEWCQAMRYYLKAKLSSAASTSEGWQSTVFRSYA
ncbi:hypothetical protein PM082_023456 [Marasmius tenuissimus]|nr:hypothetical protein PM082_023456 [Marasmius tenuissimus]